MKNNETHQEVEVFQQLKNLSSQDFLNIGMHDVAYVRPVVEEGQKKYAVYAANGMPLSVVKTEKDAWSVMFENDLEAVSVQ